MMAHNHVGNEVPFCVFQFRSYNPTYSRFEILCRFMFVIASFIMSLWFYMRIQIYPLQLWSMEQSWITYLSPLLVLFNNPLYPLLFLTKSSLPGIVDMLFQLTFFCSVLLFWLCVYHGIRQRVRHFMNFYLPKLIILVGMWFSASVVCFLSRYESMNSLTYYNGGGNTFSFQVFAVMFFMTAFIYGIYLVYLVIRSCNELRSKPYFDLRLRFFTFMMLLVMSVTVASLATKYGIILMLQDSFVSRWSEETRSSIAFLSFYTLINTYIASMVYVYSPSPSVLQSSNEIPLTNHDDSEDELYTGLEYEAGKLQTELHDNDDD